MRHGVVTVCALGWSSVCMRHRVVSVCALGWSSVCMRMIGGGMVWQLAHVIYMDIWQTKYVMYMA